MLSFDPKTSLVLIVAFLNFILGGFIIYNNRKEAVNKSFAIMTVLVGVWSLMAFIFRAAPMSGYAHTFGYLLYSAAALLPTSFLIMALTFPPYSLLNKRVITFLICETAVVIWFMNTPGLIIKGLVLENTEKILIWGKYYFIYAIHLLALFSVGYLILIKKYFKSLGTERQQVRHIIFGTIIPANLAMITNLILPWMGIYYFYTWLGQVFMIFLVLFSGYAIFRHHLFNIKTIAAEIFTLATSITLFIWFVFSEGSQEKWLSGTIFLAVTFFGYLLIKSVLKEVEQKERLEVLTYQLGLANEKLKVLDQARAEFISIASHQLRSPPSTTKWYLSSLLTGDFGKLSPKVRDALEKIQMTNNSLISLIEDMLNVSRIERGRMEFLFEETDVLALAEAAFLQLKPFAEIKKLKLSFKKPSQKLPLISADKEKLRQVMNNLIDNAIKYTKQGEIKVELFKQGNEIIFKVSDTGRGLLESEKQSIFEKYGRGRDSMKHAVGLGLGLYVAKAIVLQHNGKITAESQGEDKGSVFTVSIPVDSDLHGEAVWDLTKNQAV